MSDLIQLIENVSSSLGYRYTTKDNKGNSMDTAKIIDNPSGGYLAVYHTVRTVKLATSTDILNWTYKKDLETSATQPTICTLSNGGLLVAFEKHNNGGSVKINYYTSLTTLYAGTISKSYNAVRTIGKVNEGTPNIYSATLNPDIDHSTIDIGFHYQSAKSVQCSEGPDRQAEGILTNFSSWSASKQTDIDNAIMPLITPCTNIGDRDGLVFNGILYSIHEAGGGPALANFDKWRIFLYNHLSKTAIQLNIKTPKGGVVFANPTFTNVKNPSTSSKRVLVVTLFVPSQNGKDPAGTLTYYNPITDVPPPPLKYRCTGNPDYLCLEDPNGTYASLTECQNVCKNVPPTGYITVTNPKAGLIYRKGDSRVIRWTHSSNTCPTIKIELLKAGTTVKVLANSTPNDDSYAWTVPNVTTGNDYQIRISNKPCIGTSGKFGIK